VPACDQVLRNDIARQAEKDLGIKLNIETINANAAPTALSLGPATG
jgi:multiple sugar transport system substrate-binding protein